MQNSPHKDNFSETITLLDTKVSDVLSTVSNICADRHTVLELSREAKSDLCGQQPAIVNFRKALQNKADSMVQSVKNTQELTANQWACTRCSNVNADNFQKCQSRSCGACRRHGEFDCLNIKCRNQH